MRCQGWKTASLRWASQRQTKQGCFHWAGAKRKMTECGRAEAQGTVTHSSAAGLLRHELDTLWVELWPQTRHSAHLKAWRCYKVSAHIYTGGLIAAFVQLMALIFLRDERRDILWYQPLGCGEIKCQVTCIKELQGQESKMICRVDAWHMMWILNVNNNWVA